MIKIDEKNKSNCCGCTACANICPKKAIEMKEDFEGFLYPVVDKEKCINCGLCDNVCPILNKVESKDVKKASVVQLKNKDKLNQSTSGAAFVAIAEYVLENNGVVFGAGFDSSFVLKHFGVNKVENLSMIQGSKYIQSDLEDTFSKIRQLLVEDKMVLFTGTPCQVAGLKRYLQKEYKNLLTIDLVCRSVPSPKMWNSYLKYLESKYKSKVNYVKFRDKTYGYHSSILTIGFENGKFYRGSNRICLYGSLFHGDKISRPSCYECKFKSIERCSDYTLFDSWKPEELNGSVIDNDKGYSNVFMHTEKAIQTFENIKEKVSMYEIDYKRAISFTGEMVEKSIERKKERENIYIDLNNMDLKKFCRKYSVATLKDYLIEYLKRFLYRINLLWKIKKLKNK